MLIREIQFPSKINEYDTQMQECNWKTLVDFINCSFGIYKISIKDDANVKNWRNSTCTCSISFNQNICKLVIGLCIL